MDLPHTCFYLLGMGARRKLLYCRGVLSDALTGEVLRRWVQADAVVDAAEYRLTIRAPEAEANLWEDEEGLWLQEAGYVRLLSAGEVHLPRFEHSPHAATLRSLHQEILTCIRPAGPVPNVLVYPRPWYRDAAMVCMCLAKTGNLHLVEDWINGLQEPFDRNNAGHCEPDNLGQLLYMISLLDRSARHPLVDKVLREARRLERKGYIVGLTDGAEHPVYQTKWLKFGLQAIGLDDPYTVPELHDSYSALVWWRFTDRHVPGPPFPAAAGESYPCLAWAEAHFHHRPPPLHLLGDGYPLTWEANASEANYAGMAPVDSLYVSGRLCAPHTWHAAEAMLYLLEDR